MRNCAVELLLDSAPALYIAPTIPVRRNGRIGLLSSNLQRISNSAGVIASIFQLGFKRERFTHKCQRQVSGRRTLKPFCPLYLARVAIEMLEANYCTGMRYQPIKRSLIVVGHLDRSPIKSAKIGPVLIGARKSGLSAITASLRSEVQRQVSWDAKRS